MKKAMEILLTISILLILSTSFLLGLNLHSYRTFLYRPEGTLAVDYGSIMSRRTDLWYENWDGTGRTDASALNAILEQSTYTPLSRKEGMRVLWKVNKNNLLCSITGKSVTNEEKSKGTELIFIDLQVVSLQDQIYLIVGNQMKMSEGGDSGLEYDYVTTVYRANEPGKLHALSSDVFLNPQQMSWMETAWFHLKYSFPLQFILLVVLILSCITRITIHRRRTNR